MRSFIYAKIYINSYLKDYLIFISVSIYAYLTIVSYFKSNSSNIISNLINYLYIFSDSSSLIFLLFIITLFSSSDVYLIISGSHVGTYVNENFFINFLFDVYYY